MKELVLIVIGILIWQLVVFSTALVTTDDEKITFVACGIFTVILFGIARNLRILYIKKFYTAYTVFEIKDEPIPLYSFRMKKKFESKYFLKGENSIYIEPSKKANILYLQKINERPRNGSKCNKEWFEKNLLKNNL